MAVCVAPGTDEEDEGMRSLTGPGRDGEAWALDLVDDEDVVRTRRVSFFFDTPGGYLERWWGGRRRMTIFRDLDGLVDGVVDFDCVDGAGQAGDLTGGPSLDTTGFLIDGGSAINGVDGFDGLPNASLIFVTLLAEAGV